MQVYKEESQDGVLQTITFRADAGQTPPEFRSQVKTWLAANQPMSWEVFFNRLVMLEADRITISLV